MPENDAQPDNPDQQEPEEEEEEPEEDTDELFLLVPLMQMKHLIIMTWSLMILNGVYCLRNIKDLQQHCIILCA